MAQDGLWPWRPTVLPDETFSSWFARLAAGNGLTPVELFRVAQPTARRGPGDLDRYAEPSLIDSLSEHTGIPPEALRQATLDRWTGWIFESDSGANKLPWLSATRSEDGHPSFGQQVCPACLREGPEPYLRGTWRLGFVTACSQHRRLLVDRCPNCSEPIQVLRSGADHGIRCWKCFFDLSAALQDHEASDTDLHRERRLLDIAAAGWVELGEYGPVYSITYFRILMLVFRLLAHSRHATALRTWCWEAASEPGSTLTLPRIRHIAALRPRCRYELLKMTHYLMESWPHRFVEACRETGVSSQHLLRPVRGHQFPFAWWHAVEWNLRAAIRAANSAPSHAKNAYRPPSKSATTCRELVEIGEDKIAVRRSDAIPVEQPIPSGNGSCWELDGVSGEVRIAAQTAAHRTGESLGAWVDRALRQVLVAGGLPSAGAPARLMGLMRGKACRFARSRRTTEA